MESLMAAANMRFKGKKAVLFGRLDAVLGKIGELVESQGGELVDELDETVDFLILPSLAGNKKVQKEVAALNAAGAKIEMVDTASAYKRIVAEMEEAELQEEKKVRVAAQKQSATRIRKTVGKV